MRVTEKSISNRVLTGLQNNLSNLGKIQEQLSSGKQISRPSDSPTGTVSAMQLRGDLRTMDQYSRNIDDGVGWLSVADTTLVSALEQLRTVRASTMQGLSAGVGASPSAREALAQDVEGTRQSLIGLANSRYLDRPVFGGTTTNNAAYQADGTYQGDAGTVERRIGANTKVQVNVSGEAVFGAGPDQLFTVIGDIANDLRNNPTNLSNQLTRLDTAIAKVESQLAGVGSRYNRLTTMASTNADRALAIKTQLSDVEDIDLPKTIMELKLQETAYQAALAATAKVVQTSLIDFLR